MAEKHHTDRIQAVERWSSAAWPALLAVIVVCFFWKLTFTNQYTWLENAQTANQLLPAYQFQAGVWHERQIPLWDPYISGGRPVFGRANIGAAYPLNWLLFLAPLRRGWIRQSYLHWYFVLIHVQAALFFYWLCRDLKRSHAASLLSGLAFALGGFLGTAESPALVNAAIWAPLALLFFLRVTRAERPVMSAAWSGAFLGVAFLSSDPEIPVFLCLMMLGLWIYHLAKRRSDWKLFLIFSSFVVALSALQTFPMFAHGAPLAPQAESYLAQRDSSLYPQSLLGIVIPGFFRMGNPFVGLTGLTLALLGVAAAWQERVVKLMSAVALGGVLYSLGTNSVFQGVLYSVLPALGGSTHPAAAIFVFHIGLCVLIAYGLDFYYSVSNSAALRFAIRLLCGFAAVIGLIMWVLTEIRTPFDERLGMVLLAGFLVAGIFTARRAGAVSERAAVVSLGLVMLLELGNVTTYGYPSPEQGTPLLKKLSEDSDIAEFLKDQAGPVRVEASAGDIPYNFGDWYGIEYFPGHGNFVIGQEPSRPDQAEVFQGKSGLRVYRDSAPFRRAWIVHGAVQCPGQERAAQVTRQATDVILEADLKCPGTLIESDTFSPGWEALVDGRPAALSAASGSMRGVGLEAGTHRIEMRYRPKAVYWGASLTGLGLLAASALAKRTHAGH